jgi:hypothetical protein
VYILTIENVIRYEGPGVDGRKFDTLILVVIEHIFIQGSNQHIVKLPFFFHKYYETCRAFCE